MATRRVTEARFENDLAHATFFCVVELDGRAVKMVVGNSSKRDGATTISIRQGNRYATEAEAAAAFEKLLVQQRTIYPKGAKRTELELPARKYDSVAPASFNAELEAQVLATRGTPQAAEAATVYADWLIANGDVRGEVAALELAGKDRAAEARRVALDGALFGDLDVKLEIEVTGLAWVNGFLDEASFKIESYESQTDLGALTRTFLELPVARLMTGLRFGLATVDGENDWQPVIEAIASTRAAAQLERLRFDDVDPEHSMISVTRFGDLGAVWKVLPRLREFTLRAGGDGTLGDIDAPELVKFVRVSGGLPAAEIEEILAARWPKLERLELWLGSANYGAEATVRLLAPLLDGRRAPPAMTHLALMNAEITHELIGPLAKAPFLPRLKTLDLSKGALLDRDVDELVRHAGAFRHLQWIDLSENLLLQRVDEVRAALPNAVLDHQRRADGDQRYAAVGE